MSTEIIPNKNVTDRAYHLWEQAGRPHGRDLEFWLQAETEVHEPSARNSSRPVSPAAGRSQATPGVDSRTDTRPPLKKPLRKTTPRTR